jgi:hypothetical protein
MRALHSYWLCVLVGCGGSSDATGPAPDADHTDSAVSDGGVDGGEVSIGVVSGDKLFVQLQLAVRLTTPPSTYALVSVLDTVTSKSLDGATVTLTPLGGAPVTLPGGGGIPYQKGFASGWVESYDLSVTHAAGSRTGIVVKPPNNFTVAISPTPKVGAKSTVSWTPSGEASVFVYVLLGKYGTPTATPLPDNGSFEVPETAFPAPAAKGLQLEVQRVRNVSVPSAVAMQLQVSVYQLGIDVAP